MPCPGSSTGPQTVKNNPYLTRLGEQHGRGRSRSYCYRLVVCATVILCLRSLCAYVKQSSLSLRILSLNPLFDGVYMPLHMTWLKFMYALCLHVCKSDVSPYLYDRVHITCAVSLSVYTAFMIIHSVFRLIRKPPCVQC